MRLLQVTHAGTAPGVAAYTEEVRRLLGGTVFDVAAGGADEGMRMGWRQALSAAQPTAVFVQDVGGASPAMLMDLRERAIPYAVFLHDYTPLCPTHRLWHRRLERCRGPGRTGWKCAWCVSGTWRRAAELPLRTVLYRHRPQDWRTALIRAEALIAPSRFAREFWVEQGAPPERVAVVAPVAELPQRPERPPAPPRLLLTGGNDNGAGAELLAEALERVRVRVAVIAEMQSGATGTGDAVVAPARWEAPSARSVITAQLAGTPVVATAVGGLTESIIHGVNGYLATRDDPSTLAEAVCEALVGPTRAWGGERVAANARTQVEQTRVRLRRLLELLSSGNPDPVLTLEHGEWLAATARELAIPAEEVSERLIAEMRQPGEANPADPLGVAVAARARAGTRHRQLDLNHAIAYFRACGCHRIASLPESGPLPGDAAEALCAWGLETVTSVPEADGLYSELEDGSDIMTGRLRRQFPSVRAVVAVTVRGVETECLHGAKD